MFKFLKEKFWKKDKKPVIVPPMTLSERSEITFPDVNLTNIKLVVKTVNNEPFFFITDEKETFTYVLDTDMTIVLEAILSEFNKNGNINNIETIIKGIK